MDLPEPRKVVLTPKAADDQKWQMFATINALLIAYAAIHKFLMPWIRWGWSDDGHFYFDPWLLFHPIVAFALYRRETRAVSLASCLGLGYCLVKGPASVIQLSSATAQWSSLSSAMTEGLSLGFILPWLSSRRGERRASWGGLVLAGLLLGALSARYLHATVGTTPVRTVRSSAQIAGSSSCAPQIVQSTLDILPCGMGRSTDALDATLLIRNRSGKFLNLRVELAGASDSDPRRTWKNVPLFEGQSFTLDPSSVPAGSRIVVHSDSWKESGERTFVIGGAR